MSQHIGLYNWQGIRGKFNDGIILGNGASIAVDERFRYASLLEHAKETGRIPQNISKIFNHLHTEDFELVLRMLWHACHINQFLGVQDQVTSRAYQELRSALIQSVCDVHVPYQEVSDKLLPIANYLKHFKTVISLNYDLVVYWAILVGNEEWQQKWLKDCFNKSHVFEENWDDLRRPYRGATGATLVFYPHGNLAFATDLIGIERKIHRGYADLLNTILYQWDVGETTPLFVSEGTSTQKKAAIRRSPYLNNVYDTALRRLGRSIVIYGWSISECDDHILDAILSNSDLESVAISVHQSDGWEDKCRARESKIKTKAAKVGKQPNVIFFDASSEGCWIYP